MTSSGFSYPFSSSSTSSGLISSIRSPFQYCGRTFTQKILNPLQILATPQFGHSTEDALAPALFFVADPHRFPQLAAQDHYATRPAPPTQLQFAAQALPPRTGLHPVLAAPKFLNVPVHLRRLVQLEQIWQLPPFGVILHDILRPPSHIRSAREST